MPKGVVVGRAARGGDIAVRAVRCNAHRFKGGAERACRSGAAVTGKLSGNTRNQRNCKQSDNGLVIAKKSTDEL